MKEYPPPIETPHGKVLTYTTSMLIADGGLHSSKIAKMEKVYIDYGTEMVAFKETFVDTKWEAPGWASPIKNLAAFYGRFVCIVQGLRELPDLNPMELANEERALLICGQQASDHNFPFYVVGRKLLEAAKGTKPFKEWDFNAFPLPFPSLSILLPKGTKFNNQLITHFSVMSSMINRERKIAFIGANGSFPIFIAIHGIDEDGKLDVAAAAGREYGRNDKIPHEYSEACLKGDALRDVSLGLMQLVLNLIGIMHARKEQVSEEKVLRVVGRNKTTIKRPRMLGISYTYKTQAAKSESTGRKVESHWRRGHWHTVSYGKGRASKRIDWFEPIYVCAGSAG